MTKKIIKKAPFLILFIAFFSVLFQDYFLSYIFLGIYCVTVILQKKWRQLIICGVLSILLINATQYCFLKYYDYENEINNFVYNKIKETDKYIVTSGIPENIKQKTFKSYYDLQEELNKSSYTKKDILVTYNGSFKNRIFYNVKLNNICFSMSTSYKKNKTDPFYFDISAKKICK